MNSQHSRPRAASILWLGFLLTALHPHVALGFVSKLEPMAVATGVEAPNVAIKRPAASAVGSEEHGMGVLKQSTVAIA